MRPRVAVTALTVLVTAAGLSTGCAASSGGSSAASSCAPGKLDTYTSGVFTVATDSPAYAPWFADDKPTNGKGYESAVAFAVAKKLGYPAEKVRWTVAAFNSVIAPTPKKFDVDLNQVSITTARAKAVDFSSGYYDVKQAVISLKSGRYAHATTVAALKGAKLGAQVGTTSLTAITDDIEPSTTPAEYKTNDLAVQALRNGQIDALVVDLPTALYITGSGEVKDSTIVGQLPAGAKPEQFGMVLDKGSPITGCVSDAVDALRADGTLAALEKKWLTTSAGAPELT